MKIAVFASGNGSNFEVIAQAVAAGQIEAELTLLFCDNPKAFVLNRGEKHDVKTLCFSPKDFNNKTEYEKELTKIMLEHQIDLIVLAGYMRIIGPTLLDAFPNRIINIHPSLLPSFPGLHGIKDAYDYGVKITGITIHYIDAGVDTGPIIAQAATPILPEDTLESLEEKIHQLEHHWYPKVLADITRKRSLTEND
ncbi:MAG: phosphoribosylglycinamide formyltransferase [Enterococcus lemanii]|jgi:phosphoribosylglycinamide formyltransferase-1